MSKVPPPKSKTAIFSSFFLLKPYASAAAVGAVFGLGSQHYAKALNYFGSYLGSTQIPGALLMAQYNQVDVPAYLQSASVAG